MIRSKLIVNKEGCYIIQQQLLEKKKHLESLIPILENEIKKLPKGNFFCCKQKEHYKWYRKLNLKQIYISKKDRPLAEKLAYRKYLSYLLDDSKNELGAIDFYLRHHKESKSEQFLLNPEHQRLLSPFFKPTSQELFEWMQEPYERHPYTGETFYYEHFGRMDDPEYSMKAGAKIHLYASHGIIPSVNLLMTYETQDQPLHIETIEKLVREYFL